MSNNNRPEILPQQQLLWLEVQMMPPNPPFLKAYFQTPTPSSHLGRRTCRREASIPSNKYKKIFVCKKIFEEQPSFWLKSHPFDTNPVFRSMTGEEDCVSVDVIPLFLSLIACREITPPFL